MPDEEPRMAKIVFKLGSTDETLWAEVLGQNRFHLDNNPIFVCGVSYGDEVEATPTEHEFFYEFTKVVKKSGNKTIRIFSKRPKITDKRFQPVLNDLIALGCDYEGFAPHLVSVNIPAEVELSVVTDYLNSKKLMWESADPTYEELTGTDK